LVTCISFVSAQVPTKIKTIDTIIGIPAPLEMPVNSNNEYTIIDNVNHGTLKVIDGYYNYIGTKIGEDELSFSVVNNNTMIDNIKYLIHVKAKDTPLLFDDSQLGIALRGLISFTISFVIVIIIYIVLNRLIKQNNRRLIEQNNNTGSKSRLLDIILDEEWHPSLALFQFTLWTIVIIVVFFGIYLFGVLSGYGSIMLNIPINLLVVMGLSTSSGAVGFVLSRRNYGRKPIPRPTSNYPFLDMLKENGKMTITRFQMFSWTFIGIAYYLASVLIKFLAPSNDIMSIPDLPETFVFLMGISQFSYLMGKYLSKPDDLEATEFFPSLQHSGETIQIFGMNFKLELLHQTSLWLTSSSNTYIINGSNDSHPLTIVSSERLDVKIPDDVVPGEYNVMVSQGSIPVKLEGILKIIGPIPL
jgi:hypothetical protein